MHNIYSLLIYSYLYMHTQRLTFTIMLYKNVDIRLGNTKYCTSACAMTGEKKSIYTM